MINNTNKGFIIMNGADEIRKYINLFENRQPSDDISYVDAGKNKAATVNKEFEKVTATLTGNESGKFTKLAKKFKLLDMIAKRASEKRNQLNEQTKEAVDGLFDVEDQWLTRYVETVSMSVTVAKSTMDSPVTTEKFDSSAFLAELYTIVDEGLFPVIKELESKYTTIETKTKKGGEGRLATVKIKESDSDSVYEKLESFSDTFKQRMDPLLESIGSRISEMKMQMNS